MSPLGPVNPGRKSLGSKGGQMYLPLDLFCKLLCEMRNSISPRVVVRIRVLACGGHPVHDCPLGGGKGWLQGPLRGNIKNYFNVFSPMEPVLKLLICLATFISLFFHIKKLYLTQAYFPHFINQRHL